MDGSFAAKADSSDKTAFALSRCVRFAECRRAPRPVL